MTISSISSGSGLSAAQLHRLPPTGDSASDTTTSGATRSSGASRFTTAINDAFASLGISLDASGGSTSITSASNGTDASTDSSDGVGAFVQSLLAALHGQSAANATPPAPSDDGSATTTTQATQAPTTVASTAADAGQATGRPHGHGGHRHGGGGKIEADLQSLIQSLSTPSTATATDASSSTTSTSTDFTLSTLEKNFDALVSQGGGSTATTGADTLTSFLKALASGLHGAPATGNVVTAEA